jgi:carbamoyl-phosphate synthase large subunit
MSNLGVSAIRLFLILTCFDAALVSWRNLHPLETTRRASLETGSRSVLPLQCRPTHKETVLKRVLITFAGGQLGRGVAHALKAVGPVHIIAADADGYALFQSPAEERYVIPRADEPDYMEALRDLVRRTGPDLVWPMHDNEVARIVADEREPGARTFLPPREVVELCHDKFASSQAFKAAGVPVPETMLLQSEPDLFEAFRRFGEEIWIRPVKGAGGRGALGTRNRELARIWIDELGGWGKFTAAEKLDTEWHTFESVWRDGELIVCQSSSRIPSSSANEPGVLGQGRTPGLGIRRRNPPSGRVREVAVAAAKAVSGGRPHGIYSVDLRDDRNGVANVTEINIGRFGMSGAICFYDQGANFPDIALKVAFDEDPGFKPPLIDPLRTDVAALMSIGSERTVVKDSAYMALAQEFETRRASLR